MRAGFYIRRRPQYHPALDPPPSYIRRRVSGGFHRGRAVEGGVSRAEAGRRNSWAGFYRGTGVEGGVSRVEGGFRGLKLGRRNSWGRVSTAARG